MNKEFDFNNVHINSNYVHKKTEYNEFQHFNFAYEKANKPNFIAQWYVKQTIKTKIMTRIGLTVLCATMCIGSAKLGLVMADSLWDRVDNSSSHSRYYDDYNYLGRFNPMNIEINRGRR